MWRNWTFCCLLQNEGTQNSRSSCRERESVKVSKVSNGFQSVKVYQLSENSATGQQDYYAFAVGAGESTGGSEVDLEVGGVMLSAVLIDSGASCSVIDQTTWETMKKESVQCNSKKLSKKLFVYGRKEPIEVIGTFLSEIVCDVMPVSTPQANIFWS